MMQSTLPLDGTALKRAGQQIAIDHTEAVSAGWTERTLIALQIFCQDLKAAGKRTFLMEDFRESQRAYPPASPNCWGAFTNTASRRMIIRWTGEYDIAKSAKTHAHSVKRWEAL